MCIFFKKNYYMISVLELVIIYRLITSNLSHYKLSNTRNDLIYYNNYCYTENLPLGTSLVHLYKDRFATMQVEKVLHMPRGGARSWGISSIKLNSIVILFK